MSLSLYLNLLLSFSFVGLTLTIPASPRSFKIAKDPRIPITTFSCQGRTPGYYADVETGCQVYHMCDDGSRHYSYACPNTTLFHQRMLICAHWYQVNCSHSEHDFNANLLIGQKDKPFVGEDFWKHRFGGAGNTNFPPQEIPIRTVQSNAIHEYSINTEKSSDQVINSPTKVPFKVSNKVQNTFFVPQQQKPSSPDSQPPIQQQVLPNREFLQPQPTQNIVFQPPSTPNLVSQPNPTQNIFIHPQPTQKNIPQPAIELIAPEITSPQSNFFAQIDETKILKPSIELETPLETSAYQVSSTSQSKPSIELEPPLQNDFQASVENNIFPQNKREDNIRATANRGALPNKPVSNSPLTNSNTASDNRLNQGLIQSKQPETVLSKVDPSTSTAAKENATFDDRFTQVFILPSGKQPVKGPHEHPDLIKNKVIFTDWNSIYEHNTEGVLPTNNFNEYINGKIPGEEEAPEDDLQRDFSNYPRPFSVQSTTEKQEAAATIQSEVRIPVNQLILSQKQSFFEFPVSGSQPAIDLLPPFGPDESTYRLPENSLGPNDLPITTVTSAQVENSIPNFGHNFPSTGSNAEVGVRIPTLSSELLPPDSDDVIIQNPFQHPFYKVKKMNDDRNIIFIPLKDADFALELHKIPLNRTRTVRRVRIHNKNP